ncbi:lovastatin nonaketide synthase [Penicillium longicatenatum]|uniref:lovastatin nonaketide synthase n=1 Tax=Penicillium longicatenatum TaxID=1561947 RepID=UPI0025497BD9|nr:lovastatin nonaketide synthase [Penicillium longicatenatum]KAJ5657590.1 lovastatin nonaketide synthase [Penicillium longicatenatum]
MENRAGEPIAIVGSGCRFPGGSSSPARLWELLSQPRDVSSHIPEDRFNWQSFYHPDGAHHGTSNTARGYFLKEGIRDFDTKFFNIPPSEADTIDPQQRLLLEVVYEAIESAGMTLQGMQGTQTGVFLGMMSGDYEDLLLEDLESVPKYVGTGVQRSMHANRVSYFFDWHGPSMSIDTACSSSMVAIYLAVQALRNGDASVAIAAGASLIIGPGDFIALSNLNMVAPDGRSKMWDAEADGYARGEGVGVVVLKPLSAALKDGDPIECVIREVFVNQDGRTQGITVPNGEAQADLIRETYRRAGLDLNRALDRPQYFEAHGTGTPAGDPQEARAIASAFFGADDLASSESPLYVGSIKTVIGHTEGAAGIAGILKTSLALQHGYLPPNQHFNNLSSSVAPFAKNLEIPASLNPWPSIPNGGSRRASVNSFGFGGSNAHAILESFDPLAQVINHDVSFQPPLSPFTFSAPSERSLKAVLHRMAEHLQNFPDTNMRDLAYTLQVRRSIFPFRTTLSALTVSELCQKIHVKLESSKGKENPAIGVRALSGHNKTILGVFTGQGAQWIGMGKELIAHLPYAQEILEQLQQSLDTLSDADKPSWSLHDQLFADQETSRLSETAISQPLITAIQIILVSLLQQAGVELTAVVGHSSGEIAAAYAAGFITATDAIRNAYYRGVFAKLAAGPNQEKGAMLAAGISLDEAKDLCSHPYYRYRAMVAASNSPVSVTLSGDIDAIESLKFHLDETGKFCRPLRVEAGYHSHHMLPIVPVYVQALSNCGVKAIVPGSGHPRWWSSVHPSLKQVGFTEDLGIEYWRDNMVQSVLFNQAVENAVASAGPFDIAIEIGPHPALRGPFLQTLNALSENEIPYFGCLSRGKDSLETFSETLGSLWSHIGPSAVNLDAYERGIAPGIASRAFLRGLPSHPWNYERPYWFDSRVARDKWHCKGGVHSLLGVDAGGRTETEVKWRNFLRLNEMPWLEHHRIHDQSVFPTTGYMCMAWEAALKISDGCPIQLFELRDIEIGQGILLNDTYPGVEVLFTLTDIVKPSKTMSTMHARFSCHSCANKDDDLLVLNARGEIIVTYGTPLISELPAIHSDVSNLVETDTEELYTALNRLGYGYSGDFKSLVSLKRKRNHSWGLMRRVPTDLLIHPATLDVAFQAILAATSYPGDGALWAVYTPVSVRYVSFNPHFATMDEQCDENWSFEAALVGAGAIHSEGTAQVYPQGTSNAVFQMEGITAKPFRLMTEADDRKLFSKIVLKQLAVGDHVALGEPRALKEDLELASILERISHYYLRQLHRTVSEHEDQCTQPHQQNILSFTERILNQVPSGQHAWTKEKWVEDTKEDILEAGKEFAHIIDLPTIHSVGESLLSAIQEETATPERLSGSDMLHDYYRNGLGFPFLNNWLAEAVHLLVHRFPQMHILEFGAGTGAITESILKSIGLQFKSYTYVNRSSCSFASLQEKFKGSSSKMEYRTLDFEADFAIQGFQEHSFDLIIASSIVYSAELMETSLSKVRSLLRPGGYLMLSELTKDCSIQNNFLMSALTLLSAGFNHGRQFASPLSTAEWDDLLCKSGFSGVDIVAPTTDSLPYPVSIMVSQAVDSRIDFLREPLFCPDPYMSAVGNLGDLNHPTFKSITETEFQGVKRMTSATRNILWVTSGSQGSEPYNNMSIGFIRSLVYEMPDMRLQLLDIDDPETLDALYVTRLILRICALSNWAEAGQLDDLVWTFEPEIYLQGSKEYIPRLVHDQSRNDRYNTRQRIVTHTVNSSRSPVYLEVRDTSYFLNEKLPAPWKSDTTITIAVLKSTLSALNFPSNGFAYIAYGLIEGTSEAVIVPTHLNASILRVPREALVRCGTHTATGDQVLEKVFWELIASRLLEEVACSGNIVIYQPPRALLSVLIRALSEKDMDLFEIAHDPASNPAARQIIVPPRTMTRHIKSLLPMNVSLFADFSPNGGPGDFVSRLRVCLPPKCNKICSKDLFGTDADFSTKDGTDLESVLSDLTKAVTATLEVPTIKQLACSIIWRSPEECASQIPGHNTGWIVDWTANSDVTVQTQPATAHVVFRPDKTYLLVGLTTDLGQALCEWMISRGARIIALASRTPRIEQSWLDAQRRKGAEIHIYTTDVTKKQEVCELYDDIITVLPPVAGVANGAMVLRDSLYVNTTIDMLNEVLGPKVNGSQYLDELFSDPGLDFFILFSSMGVVTGNRGQTSYNAANAYLTALTAQRQSRGLPASVMNLGPVLGLGYITRAGLLSGDDIENIGAYPISESDLLENFAEAILASSVLHRDNYEIISGPRGVDPVVNPRVSWVHNPRMSHLQSHSGSTAVDNDNGSLTSFKKQLLEANSLDKVQRIVLNAFTTKLSTILQLSVNSIDTQAPLIDLGVDSLVALDIRSWLMKSLSVEVPLLEILSGSTVSDIANYATQNLPTHDFSDSAGLEPLAPSLLLVHSENDSPTYSNDSTGDSVSMDQTTLKDDSLTPSLSPSLPEEGHSLGRIVGKSSVIPKAPVGGSIDGIVILP